MNKYLISLLLSIMFIYPGIATTQAQNIHVRINQCGYLPTDSKIAMAFSSLKIGGEI